MYHKSSLLETLFIAQRKSLLNKRNEYRSQELTLKYLSAVVEFSIRDLHSSESIIKMFQRWQNGRVNKNIKNANSLILRWKLKTNRKTKIWTFLFTTKYYSENLVFYCFA